MRCLRCVTRHSSIVTIITIGSLPCPVHLLLILIRNSKRQRCPGLANKRAKLFRELHLLVSLGGVILDFELAPASAADLTVGAELLSEHTDLTVFGDKGSISAELARHLLRQNCLTLITLPRRNQKLQLPPDVCHTFNAVRQIIETVNGQLTEQFNLQPNYAHSFWGLCARLLTKLTAHTLCIYLNRLLGKADFLQIKALAFLI